jgi:hypothetical protein
MSTSPLMLSGVQTVTDPFYNPMGAVYQATRTKTPKVFVNPPEPIYGGSTINVFKDTHVKAATKKYYGMLVPGLN